MNKMSNGNTRPICAAGYEVKPIYVLSVYDDLSNSCSITHYYRISNKYLWDLYANRN
jgi:hypothetical protein